MSTGPVVLFVAIVVLVVALAAWLVLRGRAAPNVPVADPSAADAAAAREPGNPLDPSDSDDDSTDFHERGRLGEGDVAEVQAGAEGAEFDGAGLSVLDGDDSEPGEVSGSDPKTPTEAFGEAQGAGQVSPADEERRSGSLLDDPDSDSTPLFRSMREQLMASAETPVEAAGGMRRISELHEVVDGGFGIGSAAPIDGGVQPLGHPIKGELASKTYRDLHSASYETAEPDVWFLDPGFAERAGFRRVD